MGSQPYSIQYINIEKMMQKRRVAFETRQRAMEKFQQTDQKLQQKITTLATLKKEHVLLNRQLKEVDTEIFDLKMRLADIEEGADYVAEQLENLKNQRRKFKHAKEKTQESIVLVNDEYQSASRNLTLIEDKVKELQRDVSVLEREKDTLTAGIEQCLDNTSLKREEVEKELTGYNEEFILFLGERGKAKKATEDYQKAIAQEKAQLKALKEKVTLMEEVRALLKEQSTFQKKLKQHKTENNGLAEQLAPLKNSVQEKESKLKQYKSENQAMEKELCTLEKESEIFGVKLENKRVILEELTESRRMLTESENNLQGALLEQTIREQGLLNVEKMVTDLLHMVQR